MGHKKNKKLKLAISGRGRLTLLIAGGLMKVIGMASNGDFILQATDDEVANLIGYKYSTCIASMGKLKEINISSMFNQLYGLSKIEERLDHARKELLGVAESLKSPIPFSVVAKPDREDK